jgi:hypothetical protein
LPQYKRTQVFAVVVHADYAVQYNIEMISFKVALLLLCCGARAGASCSICVTNGEDMENECQQQSHLILHSLSDITIYETNYCRTVSIKLTSGTHILSRNLDLRNMVQETEIQGASNDKPSIIECFNNSGIRFSENGSANMVLVSNVVLVHCQQRIGSTLQASLYFKNANYTLNTVTVKDTDGFGVYAENCREQTIFNSTFTSNMWNIVIIAYTSVTVSINQTKIYDGKLSSTAVDCSGVYAELGAVSNNFSLTSMVGFFP